MWETIRYSFLEQMISARWERILQAIRYCKVVIEGFLQPVMTQRRGRGGNHFLPKDYGRSFMKCVKKSSKKTNHWLNNCYVASTPLDACCATDHLILVINVQGDISNSPITIKVYVARKGKVSCIRERWLMKCWTEIWFREIWLNSTILASLQIAPLTFIPCLALLNTNQADQYM